MSRLAQGTDKLPNFYGAEQDPLATDVLIAEGHQIEGGFFPAGTVG